MMVKLTPQAVTIASRIMLPADVVMSMWVGVAWLVQDDARTKIPAFDALRDRFPIWGLGLILVIVASVQVVALLIHHRALCAGAIGTAALVYLVLCVFILASLWQGSLTSFSAPAWAWYAMVAHVATIASLARDEYTDGTSNRSAA